MIVTILDEILMLIKKINIYDLGIKVVKKFIRDYQVDCDWNETGKYFASSLSKDINKLYKFKKILDKLNFENQILNANQLKKNLEQVFTRQGFIRKGVFYCIQQNLLEP